MRSEQPETRSYRVTGAALPLSGEDLAVLMSAVLERGHSFRFRAPGSSMLPFVCDGDVLTIAPLGGRPPVLGDLVAFRHPAKHTPTVHRVVARRAGAYRVQGDAVPVPDGWIAAESVLGRVAAIERAGRRLRWGLGPERAGIALVSRWGLWRHALPVLARLRRLRGAERPADGPGSATGEDR
ncbi:MAG: S26 family signal peptidase [Chloroflexi bacterium]|nr:S26 family signal peptidase [Chloroflexota bacterium]